MTPLGKLTTLGALSLEIAGKPVLSGRRKVLTLLAYLTRRSGRPVRRVELAVLFWPAVDEARARQSLRQMLTELREAIPSGLGVTDQEVRLDLSALEVDVTAIGEALAAGRTSEALTLWNGEFLPEAEATGGEEFRTWLEAEREGIRRRLAGASEQEILRLNGQGAWNAASDIARRWSQRIPGDELAIRRLVEALLMAGRREEAATEYRAGLQQLRSHGIEVSPEFTVLAAATEKSSAGTSMGTYALLSPDLVGRAEPMAALLHSWQEVLHGKPGSILVAGESGSGKSRLVEEFVRTVRASKTKAIVFHTRAFEAERETSFALIRHLFRNLAAAPALATTPAAVLASLAQRIPEILESFPSLPGKSEFSFADAMARALTDISEEAPVLIAVDDAHLADRESHALLESLGRRPPGRSLVVLAVPADSSVFSGSRLTLDNFDRGELEQVIASMAELRPDDRRMLVDRLMQETQGNPQAVVEIVRALAEQGVIAPGPDGTWLLRDNAPGAPLPVPVSLLEAAQARIEGLGADARTVLEASVVIGRDVNPDVLRALTGLGSERLESALEDLMGRRLLRAAVDGSPRLEFAHEHLRRAVYQSLPPLRRSEWHARHQRLTSRRPVPWYRSWITAAAAAALLLAGLGWRWLSTRQPPPSDSTAVRIISAAGNDTIFGFEATRGSLAWVRTKSSAALTEYREGERLFSAMNIPEAIQAYRRATRADTGLAVAWYRIGESGLWLLRTDVARVGADSALHYLSGLDPNEINHYRAFYDFSHGHIAEAEAKLRGETAIFPHRTESRYLLADLLFHFYWLKGTTSREPRLLFEGLRRDQPGDWRPLSHLWDIAVAEGRTAAAAAIRDTIQSFDPGSSLLDSYDVIPLFAAADSAGRLALLDSLRERDQWTLANLIRRYGNLTGDVEGVLGMAALLTEQGRPPEVRATGHLFRSVAELSLGRFERARAEARRAAAASPITGYQWAALLVGSGLPPGAALTEERRRLRETLAASGGIPLVPLAAPYYPWTDFDKRDAEEIFPYLQGRLGLDGGDSVTAKRWLLTLQDSARSAGELGPTLASSLAGALAAARGDPAEAVRQLDSAFARKPVDHSIMSVFVALPGERYAMAKWLIQAGRSDEAVGWLRGIGNGSIYDLAYLAPASFLLGDLLEAGGDRAGARNAYQRVTVLYRNADPGFTDLAERAREKVRTLAQ